MQTAKEDIITDKEEILEHITQFYEKLYTSRNSTSDPSYLLDIKSPKLSEEEKKSLNAPISLEETRIVINQMKADKCPGLDGFPIEFYRGFKKELKYTTHSLILRYANEHVLNGSAREGVISLLEKPGKDRLRIINWRPLTMLCCDYKIFAKILANRLQLVLPTIVHTDQKGFIKDRYIGHNLLELLSTLQYCEDKKVPSYLMALDYEKAFDKVQLTALEQVMSMFNLGETFIQWAMTCLRDFKSSVINAGTRSRSFKVTRGLKQGCPLSPLLFNLMVEVLAIKIRQNANIKGITVKDIRKVLGQFADDMWIVSEFDQTSFNTTIDLLEKFSLYSGLNINYNKTEILRIGSLRDSNATFYSHLPLVWSDGSIKILGIDITTNPEKTMQINMEKILMKTKGIINQWEQRDLMLIGKIQVCNTLLLPQWLYLLQVLPTPPKEILKKYRVMIRNFIWNNKPSRIKYNKLIQNYERGGLQLQDLELRDKAIKAKNIWEFEKLSQYQKELAKQMMPFAITNNFNFSDINLKVQELNKNKENKE